MTGYTVLGGYLGAGKTTLLNHLLKHNAGRRYALLINDFGDINIDADLITSQDDQQINLANGCVCCNLSDGFFEALESLKDLEPPPDHIIVEASGVADVNNLGQYGLTNDLTLDGIIVVADAETVRTKANDKYVAQTIRRQLSHADLIVLNKCDLVDDPDEITEWLRQFHSGPILPAVGGQVPVDALFGFELHDRPLDESHIHAHYSSWSIESGEACTLQQALDFVDSLGEHVIRCKGLLRNAGGGTIEVQTVGARSEVSQPNRDISTSRIAAIGLESSFDPAELDRLAATHLHMTRY